MNKKMRGTREKYSIKLFYTSNMPIILQSALVSNLYFLSQMLYKRYGGNILVRLLGVWAETEAGGGDSGQTVPVAGLVYYMTPPHNLAQVQAAGAWARRLVCARAACRMCCDAPSSICFWGEPARAS